MVKVGCAVLKTYAINEGTESCRFQSQAITRWSREMTEHTLPEYLARAYKDLTAEYVRSRLEYDPEVGTIRWKTKTFKKKCSGQWNKRFAGKEAGTVTKDGRVVTLKFKKYMAHRLIWLIVTGEWPDLEIDHRDRNRANNKWLNLRLATSSQNKYNDGKHKNNTSGYTGVYFRKDRGTFSARIQYEGRDVCLGCFKTAEDAYAAYLNAAKEFHREYAGVS